MSLFRPEYTCNLHPFKRKGISFYLVVQEYLDYKTHTNTHINLFVITKSGKPKGYSFSLEITGRYLPEKQVEAVFNKLLSELHPEYCDNTEKTEDVVLDLLSKTKLPEYLFTLIVNEETNEVEYK